MQPPYIHNRSIRGQLQTFTLRIHLISILEPPTTPRAFAVAPKCLFRAQSAGADSALWQKLRPLATVGFFVGVGNQFVQYEVTIDCRISLFNALRRKKDCELLLRKYDIGNPMSRAYGHIRFNSVHFRRPAQLRRKNEIAIVIPEGFYCVS